MPSCRLRPIVARNTWHDIILFERCGVCCGSTSLSSTLGTSQELISTCIYGSAPRKVNRVAVASGRYGVQGEVARRCRHLLLILLTLDVHRSCCPQLLLTHKTLRGRARSPSDASAWWRVLRRRHLHIPTLLRHSFCWTLSSLRVAGSAPPLLPRVFGL